MNISEILRSILEKPDAPKFYRQLQQFYLQNNLVDEAEAISHLINSKFEQNHAESDNSQHNS